MTSSLRVISNVRAAACSSVVVIAALWCSRSVAAERDIDSLLAAAHANASVQPTERCDDATFYRRLSLDLIGRVPTTDELERFVAAPDRKRAIDQRLSSNEHTRFWSQLWTTMLIGRSTQRGVERDVLRQWTEQQLDEQLPLNQLAFELIAAEGVSSLDGPTNFMVAAREDPVMRLSRVFLSIQLDCAQCHDHPHDRWTNEDYLAFKRFFRPTQFREVSGGIAVSTRASGGERPTFLSGRKPHTNAWRRELALMVVESKPFSRAMVNRVWSWLMGRGMIDPVDGLSRENKASTPELLEALATDLRNSSFALRPLIRRICSSQAYQRSSLDDSTTDTALQLRLFAARNARPMLPSQWIASTNAVLQRSPLDSATLARRSAELIGVTRQADLNTDPFDWKSNTQALIRELSSEISTPINDVDSLFLATLARTPTQTERRHIASHSMQDTLFALVHCNEFLMND